MANDSPFVTLTYLTTGRTLRVRSGLIATISRVTPMGASDDDPGAQHTQVRLSNVANAAFSVRETPDEIETLIDAAILRASQPILGRRMHTLVDCEADDGSPTLPKGTEGTVVGVALDARFHVELGEAKDFWTLARYEFEVIA